MKVILTAAMIWICTATFAQSPGMDIMRTDSSSTVEYLIGNGWWIKETRFNTVEVVSWYTNEYMCLVFFDNRCAFIFGLYSAHQSAALDILLAANWRMVSNSVLVKNGEFLSYEYEQGNYTIKHDTCRMDRYPSMVTK